MIRTAFTVPLIVAALALAACATSSTAPPVTAAPAPAPVAFGGPEVRGVEMPAAAPGEPREVRTLVDEPSLKLVSIALRGGTALPTHHSAVPVTIVAVAGSGTVIAGAERLRLDPTHAVVLAPRVPHAVEPDAGTDLVLLVHHLGPRSHAEEHHE